jgi:hypothetical protein
MNHSNTILVETPTAQPVIVDHCTDYEHAEEVAKLFNHLNEEQRAKFYINIINNEDIANYLEYYLTHSMPIIDAFKLLCKNGNISLETMHTNLHNFIFIETVVNPIIIQYNRLTAEDREELYETLKLSEYLRDSLRPVPALTQDIMMELIGDNHIDVNKWYSALTGTTIGSSKAKVGRVLLFEGGTKKRNKHRKQRKLRTTKKRK